MTCPRFHSWAESEAHGWGPQTLSSYLHQSQTRVGCCGRKKNRKKKKGKKSKETTTQTPRSFYTRADCLSLSPLPSSFSPEAQQRAGPSEATCPPTPILCWVPSGVKAGARPTRVGSPPSTAHGGPYTHHYLPGPDALRPFQYRLPQSLQRGPSEPAPCLARGSPSLGDMPIPSLEASRTGSRAPHPAHCPIL